MKGTSERKWPLENLAYMEGNIITDLQEICRGALDWIGLIQNRERCQVIVHKVTNIRVPYFAGGIFLLVQELSLSKITLSLGVG
jgi:hypothetical protein